MECKTIEQYLDLYLDGELAQEERKEIEVHLFECEQCRNLASLELRWRQNLRRAFGNVKAPSGLKKSLARSLAEQASKEERQRTFSTLAYVGIVLVLAVACYSVMGTFMGRKPPGEAAVRVDSELTPSEKTGDSTEVLQFLKTHAPFSFRLPLKEGPGVRLVGARITKVGHLPAIVYHYEVGNRRVSVTQYPNDWGGQNSSDRYSLAGYTVLTFGDSKLTHLLVGDIPRSEAQRIVPASWRMGPTGP